VVIGKVVCKQDTHTRVLAMTMTMAMATLLRLTGLWVYAQLKRFYAKLWLLSILTAAQ